MIPKAGTNLNPLIMGSPVMQAADHYTAVCKGIFLSRLSLDIRFSAGWLKREFVMIILHAMTGRFTSMITSIQNTHIRRYVQNRKSSMLQIPYIYETSTEWVDIRLHYWNRNVCTNWNNIRFNGPIIYVVYLVFLKMPLERPQPHVCQNHKYMCYQHIHVRFTSVIQV